MSFKFFNVNFAGVEVPKHTVYTMNDLCSSNRVILLLYVEECLGSICI